MLSDLKPHPKAADSPNAVDRHPSETKRERFRDPHPLYLAAGEFSAWHVASEEIWLHGGDGLELLQWDGHGPAPATDPHPKKGLRPGLWCQETPGRQHGRWQGELHCVVPGLTLLTLSLPISPWSETEKIDPTSLTYL